MAESIDSEILESSFKNSEGVSLCRYIYKPISSPIKAFLFICHGLFEHSQSSYYETIIRPLTSLGCFVLTHDHYGHGRSEGSRGIISNLDILVRDTLMDIEKTIEEFKIQASIPIFIYGHSMGGLISVHAALQKKNYFMGVILEAPALQIFMKKIVLVMIKGLSRIYPPFKLPKTDYSQVCRDADHIMEIKNDKYQINSPLSVMTAQSIADSIILLQPRVKDFDSPVFIGHGDDDKLCWCKGSEAFIRNIASTDKTLVIYPRARHRLRMETENVNLEFRNAVIDWISKRIG